MAIRDPKQTAEEKVIFDAFLTAYPSFAASVFDHFTPDADFPDRIVKCKDGSQIDFELAQWIHPEQMAQGKRREQLAEAIEAVIGIQGINSSQHFDHVLIFPREPSPRFASIDASRFREDIWALVKETEQRWPDERYWHSPSGRHISDFQVCPVIGKYVRQVVFYPRDKSGIWGKNQGVPWINVSSPCSSYSPDTAFDALNAVLQAKLTAYGGLNRPPRLLVYYSAAVAYNTPWYGINYRNFSDVAKKAAQMVASQQGFEKIYLLKALESVLEAFEVFPTFTKCH